MEENIVKVQAKLIAIGFVDMIATRIAKDKDGAENDGKCVDKFLPDIKSMIRESNFFEQAPFKWLNMCYRFGIEHGCVDLRGINKTYLDLGVTVELQYDEVEYCSWHDIPKLCQILEVGMLDAIIYVGQKYKLPTKLFEERFAEIGGYPELPDNYQSKLPPSANRPTVEQVEGWMEARDSARKTSRTKRGRDPRGRIAVKEVPKYAQFQKQRYDPMAT